MEHDVTTELSAIYLRGTSSQTPEALDPEFKAKVPLRRVWVPAE